MRPGRVAIMLLRSGRVSILGTGISQQLVREKVLRRFIDDVLIVSPRLGKASLTAEQHSQGGMRAGRLRDMPQQLPIELLRLGQASRPMQRNRRRKFRRERFHTPITFNGWGVTAGLWFCAGCGF